MTLLVFYNSTFIVSPDNSFEGFVIEKAKFVGLPLMRVVVVIDTNNDVSYTVLINATSVNADYSIAEPSPANTFSWALIGLKE